MSKATFWAATVAAGALLAASPALASPAAPVAPLEQRLKQAEQADQARDARQALPIGTNLPRGNVIFIHPDGTGASWWQTGRLYWKGADGALFWDRLPYIALYRGHSNDVNLPPDQRGLVSSSNSGATTHAFGFKVQVPDSFGQDGPRSILSLSGYPGSILREAANRWRPVGVVNDGDLAEPGTGAFLAEVGNRGEGFEILSQMIFGRPGQNDRSPIVLLGGGEAFALPADAPQCPANVIRDDCFLHRDPVTGAGPEGPVDDPATAPNEARNLIAEARAAGWTVIRTRGEFDALLTRLKNQPSSPRVLGLFARDDIFNDAPEERLIAGDPTATPPIPPLVQPGVPAADKRGNLILYGSAPGTPGFNPPTAAEMTDLALLILEQRSNARRQPFMLVAEVEGTDNFGNNNNAIGGLVALKHADDMIGVARLFQERRPQTLILTGADGDAGQMTALAFTGSVDPNTGRVQPSRSYNPTGVRSEEILLPADGRTGRLTQGFDSAPDDFDTVTQFGVGWIGTPDNYGQVVSRAQGLNAHLLSTEFSTRFDNTDVYRLMYGTLFGRLLPEAYGRTAPTRE